ncbi:MAG TPA: serine--tRNA ligase [Bacteroidia bacterium]|nr:serine--tRNA ligase [Bacteroidia bacterium]HRS58084.1 serine--tRNA ligase [Bacteroidia bacterium]HRU66895.1 serine--tRNA ligase [Bacteroidia bacterium]
MLTLQTITQKKDEVVRLLDIKHFKNTELIDKIIELDAERKKTQSESDRLQAEMNRISKEIGILFQKGEKEKANVLKNKSVELKERINAEGTQLQTIVNELNDILLEIPNLPHPLVIKGESEADNQLIRQHGEIAPSENLPHWEIAEKSGIIDFETGVKITGSGFPVYRGKGAKLQRALINYFLDHAVNAGYTEIEPPVFVNRESAFGTCQLPDKDGQMYFINEDNYYLIPTAEVPLTNIYRDKILDIKDLPVKITGYTPCFRREAGSYGKNVRGLNRLHQFDKVEIVQITTPEKSYTALEEMVSHVENILLELGLVFRIIRLCGKDMSFASAMTYDFEVYSFGQQRWLEVSSVSNFESFQANRLRLRYKDENGKNQTAHTLNGSALALPRIVAAILEHHQQDNKVLIPDKLLPYTGFEFIEF